MIVLPGSPEFDQTLGEIGSYIDLTQFFPDAVLIRRSNSVLLEVVSPEEAIEYLLGGEYDEVLQTDELDDCELEADF